MPLVLKVRTEQNFEILKCAKSTNQNFFLRLDIYSRRGIVLTICLTCRNGRNMVLIRSPFYGYCFHRLLNGQFFSLLINWYFYNFAQGLKSFTLFTPNGKKWLSTYFCVHIQTGKAAIVTVFTNGEVASQKNVYQSFSKNALLLGLFLSFISFE